jgi:hypothetical protein
MGVGWGKKALCAYWDGNNRPGKIGKPAKG